MTGRCSHCGHIIPSDALAFIHEGRVLCWRCRDANGPICPLCASDLTKRPKRAGACPTCGGRFRIAEKCLVTESEGAMIEGLRTIRGVAPDRIFEALASRPWAPLPRMEESTAEWVVALLEALATGRGRGVERSREVVETAANRLATAAGEYALVLARTLWEIGRDYRPALRLWFRRELIAFRDVGIVKGVQISCAPEACRQCRRHARGRTWSIDAALSEEPLPCAECTMDECASQEAGNQPDEENTLGSYRSSRTSGWCRCSYVAVRSGH